jgi:hypothetical protein
MSSALLPVWFMRLLVLVSFTMCEADFHLKE